MVYLEDFEVFYEQAVEMFKARPLDTRYNVKYRHCDGKLVLKVTDNVQVSRGSSLGDAGGSAGTQACEMASSTAALDAARRACASDFANSSQPRCSVLGLPT